MTVVEAKTVPVMVTADKSCRDQLQELEQNLVRAGLVVESVVPLARTFIGRIERDKRDDLYAVNGVMSVEDEPGFGAWR